MSLINQALRKAQRDRTPNRMVQPGEQPAAGGYAATPASDLGMKPSLMIGLIIMVALLIGVITGLSIVLFKDSPAPIATIDQPSPPPLASPPADTPSAITPSTPAATQPTSNTVTPETTPSVIDELRIAREQAEAKAIADAKAAQEAETARVAAEAKLEAARVAAEAEAEAARVAAEAEAERIAAAQPSQEIIDWLSQAKVSGVRLSDSGSKVILNGKAYSIGETVHFGLGLKVRVIQEKRILFEDRIGKKYMKRL